MQVGGLEGEALQEHSFVARFCRESRQKRATKKEESHTYAILARA
jgi:hypothetical protein